MAAVSTGVLAIAAVFWGLRLATPRDQDVPMQPPVHDGSPEALAEPSPAVPDRKPETVAANANGAVDDPHALWQSPTQGDPLTLAYVPQGVKCLVHLNLAAVRGSSEAQQTWRALGESFHNTVSNWERKHGITLSDQQHLLLASVPKSDGTLAMLVRGTPRANWSVPSAWKPIPDLHDHYTSAGSEAVIVEVHGQLHWLLGDPKLVREAQDSPPVLQRQLEQLRRLTDQNRQVTLLATSSFLWTYGAEQFGAALSPLLQEIEIDFGRGLQAFALSCQVDAKETYLELDTAWRGDALPQSLEPLREKHGELVQRAWQQALNPRSAHPYWRALADRLPAMFELLRDQLRVQRTSRQVLANASLPPAAAHNLVLATELGLHLTEDQQPAERPREELLAKPITLRFSQQSLVDALALLEEEVKRSFPERDFAVVIDGEALRTAGITRNQQIRDFDQVDVPIRQQLTQLVLKANPEQARSPSDSAQKLVWVAKIGEPTTDSAVILITTREAANAGSLDLPADFTKS